MANRRTTEGIAYAEALRAYSIAYAAALKEHGNADTPEAKERLAALREAIAKMVNARAARRALYYAAYRAKAAAAKAAAAKAPPPEPLEEPMNETTHYTIREELLGPRATPCDLSDFYDRLLDTAHDDQRVAALEGRARKEHGEAVEYELTLDGTVTAEAFVNEVLAGKHEWNQTTTCTIYGESLGEAATRHDLVPFYDRFQEAADEDPRVKSYGCEEITDSDHEPVAYRITLRGTVTVTDFVNEVVEGKHGSW